MDLIPVKKAPVRILVSNPSFEHDNAWLPYFWGRIRSYCDFNDQRDFSNVVWEDPIFFSDEVADLVAPYDFTQIEILLLSCYVWNWEKNLEIAEHARAVNPNIRIIAGGPQVQDTDVWAICDEVTNSDGECVIADIILGNALENGKKAVLASMRSPYVAYQEDYKRFSDMITSRQKSVNAIWETNRGCPYKCTFCDWGSSTNSKIRRFDHEEILREVDVFGTLDITLVFSADANYGIFKEDLEYAIALTKTKEKYGFPRAMVFSSAKNKKTITNAAAKVLFDAGMMPTLQISYQHTDEDVLTAIKRDNISNEKLKNELEEGFKNGIPLVGAVIAGNPQDTVEKWKKGIGDLLDIGFHEDIRYYDFMILPNAPAAQPDYMEQYGIKTITRYYNSRVQHHVDTQPSRFLAEFISATNTFDEHDMVEMQTFTAFVVGFHVLNVTRFAAMHLRYYHNVDYTDFYSLLSEEPVIRSMYNEIKADLHKYIFGEKLSKNIRHGDLMVPHDLYIKIQALLNLDDTMGALKSVIGKLTNYGDSPINDLVATQRRTIVGWWEQEDVVVDHNFIDSFANINKLPPNTEPAEWSLEKGTKVLRSSQGKIGSQLPVYIYEIKTFDDWLHSPIHRNFSIRSGMNYYEELFTNEGDGK